MRFLLSGFVRAASETRPASDASALRDTPHRTPHRREHGHRPSCATPFERRREGRDERSHRRGVLSSDCCGRPLILRQPPIDFAKHCSNFAGWAFGSTPLAHRASRLEMIPSPSTLRNSFGIPQQSWSLNAFRSCPVMIRSSRRLMRNGLTPSDSESAGQLQDE